MITVVSTRSTAVSVALSRCIAGTSQQIVVEREPAALTALIQAENPDLVIVDATARDVDWQAIVRTVRGEANYRFLLVLGLGGAGEPLNAFQAGADEYVRFPFEPAEFQMRLRSIERIMRHVRCSSLQLDVGPGIISTLPAWHEIENTFAETLSQTLCVASRGVDEPVPSGNAYVAKLKLSLTKPRGAVTIYLLATESALQSMATLMLGSPASDEAVLLDVCKEVLNTLGGAFKRLALPEHDFTSSIPEMTSMEVMRHSAKVSPFMKAWSMGWGKQIIGIQATIAADEVQVLPLHSLAEGMVLADDIRNPVGVLIAPRGMHLTESAIKRLYSVFGAATMVRVSSAA